MSNTNLEHDDDERHRAVQEKLARLGFGEPTIHWHGHKGVLSLEVLEQITDLLDRHGPNEPGR